MIRKNQKKFDVKGIVALFGGKHQIVNDYEKLLRIIITPKAIEKWLERETLPTSAQLNLITIAEKRSIKFNVQEFIR